MTPPSDGRVEALLTAHGGCREVPGTRRHWHASQPGSPASLETIREPALGRRTLPAEIVDKDSWDRRARSLTLAGCPADRIGPCGIRARSWSSPAGTRCWKSSARAAWAPSTAPSRPRSGPPPGRPQADQGRHGLADRPGPVRRRTPGAGVDGPPQHRPGLRRRHHRGRISRSS